MHCDIFFKNPRLPFVEYRRTENSIRGFKPHLHRKFCVGAVLRGRVRYQVGAEQATLTPGSLALINPESLHACNSMDGEKRSFSMLYLDVDWCLQVQKSLWQTEVFIPVEDIKLTAGDLYNYYCDSTLKLMDDKVHLLEKEQMLMDLVGSIFEKTCRPHPGSICGHDHSDELKRLLSGNLREDMTIETLAAELGINPFTMIRQFKAGTGITPHAYRTNCRIDKAKEYLRQGLDIAETALECGFFDQSHLHRHFKAHTSVTPKEYQVNFIQ